MINDEGAGEGQARARPLDGGSAGARDRAGRRADPHREDRHLRHRHAHLELGRLGAAAPCPSGWHGATNSPADRGARRAGRRATSRASAVPARGTSIGGHWRQSRAGQVSSVPGEHAGIGVEPAGLPSPSTCACRPSTSFPLPDAIATRSARSSTPGQCRSTPRLSFDLVGEDVLITGAGPIGIMAGGGRRPCGRAACGDDRRQPYRLEAGAHDGRDMVPVNVATAGLREVMAELGMTQGFDVGMEMSGQPAGAGPDGRARW